MDSPRFDILIYSKLYSVMPSSPKFTTVMVDRNLVTRMRGIRGRIEDRRGYKLSWGDFIKVLLAVYEARESGIGSQVAEMRGDKPMTDEELDEAGIESFPGLPVTLSEQDQEKIAELVAQKISNPRASKKTERRRK